MLSPTPQHFNLITDPWIKVINQDNQEQLVSITDVFNHPESFRQLAGETHFQDLVILRFLLSILITVYTRYDTNDQPYPWLENLDSHTMALPDTLDKNDYADINEDYDDNQDVLLNTWNQLFKIGHFTSIVNQYLTTYQHHFDLFNSQTPFYQVPSSLYDEIAGQKTARQDYRIATGKGTVPISLFNRMINESGNSKSIFSFDTPKQKNQIDLPQLIRWLITYQNYAGSSDKGKTQYGQEHKLSNNRGWLYSTTPVFLRGQNLFETLMFNLTLTKIGKLQWIQKPVWEYNLKDYIQRRLNEQRPTNLAELYTVWCRVLHIEWSNNQPTVFALGLPGFDATDTYIEPMTRWTAHNKNTHQAAGDRPNSLAVNRISHAQKNLWRHFGGYIPVHSTEHPEKVPDIVNWIHTIQSHNYLPKNMPLTLVLAGVASDGNASSQMPAQEIYNVMTLDTDIAFSHWANRIENVIKKTNTIVNHYQFFAKQAGINAGLSEKTNAARDYAISQSEHFYDSLNLPFNQWLSSLTTYDDRDEKTQEWYYTLKRLATQQAKQLLEQSSPQQRYGKTDKNGNTTTIFTAYNIFCARLNKGLNLVNSQLSKGVPTSNHD